MSVRIHEIAKAVNKENKEVLDILRERGFDVKSVSSTIDNISAEAFIEEFQPQGEADGNGDSAAENSPDKVSTAPFKLPAGAIVKSAADIERERREREEEERLRQEAELERRRAARGIQAPKAPAPAGKAPPPAPGMRPPPPRPSGVAPSVPPRPSAPQAAAPQPTVAEPKEPEVTINKAPSAPPVPPRGNKVPVPPPAAKVPPPAPKKEEPKEDTTEEAPAEPDAPKIIQLKPPIVVRDFAQAIGLKPFKLISELMDMGIFAGMNQTLEEDTAGKLAQRHGYTLEIRHRGEEQSEKKKKDEKPDADDPALMEPRPPVVCVLGHVDHGKTTLLDAIRKADVVEGEAGGITQHIGAYQVEHNDHKITFLDTPGHAAFSKMRQRGAAVTDIAILIVAADDGFMPQTDEALKFAQKANVPVVVAINKTDSKGANIDRVKQQMQERNIAPEDWGGETLCAPISALKGEGIDELLESILLQAEILELKANPKCDAEGIIIESQVEPGRGCTATVIVTRGTLKVGTALICGEYTCKVKAMVNEYGKPVKEATPATPVRLLGWSDAPPAGANFKGVKNEKEAKRLAEEIIEERKREAAAARNEAPADAPTDLDSLLAAIDQQKAKVLSVIVKTDVAGSREALVEALEEIKSDKVQLRVIDSKVGQITKKDVDLASTSGAVIVGFNVKQDQGVGQLAKHHGVQFIQHAIIYELLDSVKEAMAELLEPEYRENKIGAAEVRQVFPVTKGFVAGCMITEGIVKRNGRVRVFRKDEEIAEGKLGTLRRFKDDVAEVRAGYECGIQVDGFNRYEEGDVIECFEVLEIRPKL